MDYALTFAVKSIKLKPNRVDNSLARTNRPWPPWVYLRVTETGVLADKHRSMYVTTWLLLSVEGCRCFFEALVVHPVEECGSSPGL